HGDIKPEKVGVQDNLVAALYGFNLSKIYVEEHTSLTTSGVTGASGYQAKELLNEDPATPATDVYAFGGLILAAMSGKQPFWNKRPVATILAVFNDKMPEPKDHTGLPTDDPPWKLLFAWWSGQPDNRPPMSTVLETTGASQADFRCVRPPDDVQDEKFKVRVKRETLIWSMVKHRNVLPFIGYQIVDEVPMIVSPWCKNGNLDIYTKAHPELRRSDKLELWFPVAQL
ncbi:hypothetical protein FRC00_004220, partial [Tulasnella sp. 408]